MSLFDLADELLTAWRTHPNYDGNDDDLPVRLVIDHEPGAFGNDFSVSICSLGDVLSELKKAGKKRILGEWEWDLEPIEPEDHWDGMWILRFWDLPTNQAFHWFAREVFKQRFPSVRPIVNAARRSWRLRLTLPDGTKSADTKFARFEAMAAETGWLETLDLYGLDTDDVWTVATNKACIEDIDEMGTYQPVLFR